MSLDRETLARAVAAQGRVARLVVARAEGSTPRETGAAMLVWADGQSGTIGGGALEFEAARSARALLAGGGAQSLSRIPLGPAMGQCCGGAVTLLTEVFDARALAALPDAIFARNVNGPARPPLPVQRLLRAARSTGQPPAAQFTGGWMVEPLAEPALPLWIYGAGHVGRALITTLAPLPDFAITWVDTAATRFPEDIADGVTRLIAANPAETVAYAPPDAHHLILTFSHALDLELCHRLLSRGFGGAGLIGSATKWARFRTRLARLGHSEAQISRIQCPIGRPELGKHPQAIAVGVAAALLARAKTQHAAKDATG